MPDKTSTITQPNQPLGDLALSGTRKSWLFNFTNGASKVVQLIAIDPATGGAVDFLYSLTAAGDEFAVPGGAGIKLTLFNGQTIYVRQHVTAAPDLYASNVSQ